MRSDIQKIIIDFDDTLFHTFRLKEMLSDVARGFGFSQEEFWYTYKQTRDLAPGALRYTLQKHAENLCDLHPLFTTPQILTDAFTAVLDQQNFIFADAYPFLDFLKGQKKTIILLSLGEFAFQRSKIEKSDLVDFFDRIEFIDTRKLDVIPKLVDKEEPVYFLNDKALETKEILAQYPHWHALLKIRDDLSPVHYEQSGLPCFKNLSDIHTYLISHN